MSRCNSPDRKPPEPTPSKRKKGLRSVSPKRRKENAVYNDLRPHYLAENPCCAYCGGPAECCDHICSGGNKAATLTNFDTINPSCIEDNRQHHPRRVKLFAKLRHVWRTNEAGWSRRLSDEDADWILAQMAEECAR